MTGIYLIENIINHKKYIGQSVNIKQRWETHKRAFLSNNKTLLNSCPILYDAFKQYGIQNFTFSILESNISNIELDKKEEYYILEYNTLYPSGYNSVLPTRVLRGENNPNSKISLEQSVQIKKELQQTSFSFQEIAQSFGITAATVYRINRGEIWFDNSLTYPIRTWNMEARAGSQNGMSKISEQQVLELRQQYINKTVEELYSINTYGYSLSGFKKMIQGQTFKNIPIYKKSQKKWIYPVNN